MPKRSSKQQNGRTAKKSGKKKSGNSVRLPDDFLTAMRPRLQDDEDFSAFVAACSRPLPTTLRFNPLRCRSLEGATATPDLGLVLKPLDLPATGYRVEGPGDPGRMLEHALGLFYIQEFASMIPATVVERLAPALPRRILDLCAAPGSKTTQLATCLAEDGFIVANEPQGSRAGVLVANLLRVGAPRSLITQMDGCDVGAALPGYFDVVLVDAPCGGEGTIRKDAQALLGWRPDRNLKLAPAQKALIRSAYEALAPGGLLVYSTCTFALAENDEVIDHLVANTDAIEFDLGPVLPEIDRSRNERGRIQVFPHHHDSGGFFVAALRKPGELALDDDGPLAVDTDLEAELRDLYGLEVGAFDLAAQNRGPDLFLAPRASGRALEALRIRRPGFRAGSFSVAGFTPDHELGLVLGSAFTKRVIEVDRDQARRFLSGLELDPALLPDDKPALLRWLGLPLGFACLKLGRFKNLLPANVVRGLT